MTGPCRDRATFHQGNSKSWVDAGSYSATFPDLESLLGNDTNAAVGIDNVVLGDIALHGVSVPRQYILGLAAQPLFVGVFGLAMGPTQSSSQAKGFDNLLSVMVAQRAIPSISFSYTAGSVKSRQSLSCGSHCSADCCCREYDRQLDPWWI
jgi:hypothetical protein